MSHTRIKFTSVHESGDIPKYWHLHLAVGQGEYTACGLAEPEYEYISEKKEKGGITCDQCLQYIKFIQSVKL